MAVMMELDYFLEILKLIHTIIIGVELYLDIVMVHIIKAQEKIR
jgi:hypothetical protein